MLHHPVIAVGLALCAALSPAFGQVCATPDSGTSNNVTITVTGEAKGRPDTMYIDLASDATAGNAADAFQQCKQKADTAVAAITALAIPDSEITRKMYEFTSATAGAQYGFVQPTAAPAGTRAFQVIEVKIQLGQETEAADLASTISRVLDAANKAGVAFKQPTPWQAQFTGEATVSPVRYVLEDATDVRDKAIADSFAKASQLKATMAESGMKMGKLVGVQYAQTAMTGSVASWATIVGASWAPSQKAASSSSPDEVTVNCTLTFTYDVEQAVKE